MELIRFRNAEDFLNTAENYLKKSETENNIILGVCANLRNNKELDKNNFFAIVEANNDIKMVAMMTPPNDLTLYSEKRNESEALSLISEALIDGGWKVSGIVTNKDLAKAFADLWVGKTGHQIIKGMNMRIYELRDVNHSVHKKGRLRQADLGDLEIVKQWTYNFGVDAGIPANKQDAYETAERKVREGYVFLWEDEGKVVSMAAKARPSQSGVVVSLVYTPKEYRNKGYASSCVAALSQYLLDSGYAYCALFTDLSNPISNSIYMKVGYKAVCDMDEYKFVK